jgi:Na+-transporting methylmalonyl-CoA/oxaloacetate decarboxylase gamma subunit
MYCSTCGTQSIQGLNYCNRCGATLNTQALVVPSFSLSKPSLILGGLVAFITLVGFGALVGGAGELARKGFDHDSGMILLILGMATILIVDVLLLRLLSRIINASLQAGTNAPARQARELAEPVPTQRKLDAPNFDAVASVTENTTRTFEPVYRETNR